MNVQHGLLEDLKSFAVERAIEQVTDILTHGSDSRLIQMTRLLERIAPSEHSKTEARRLRWLIESGHPFRDWLLRLVEQCTPHTRRIFVRNVLVNAIFTKSSYRDLFEREHGFKPPNQMVISPTQRCNMMCKGCWAGAYTKTPDMPIETVRRIIREAYDDLYMRVFVITGGEPFVRKDLLDIYGEFDDCWFIIYTNGTLIDDETAERLGELGNTMPCVSLEGKREMTDDRRGKGAYDKVMKTFERLRDNGVFYGFSATATRSNIEYLGGEKWIRKMIECGCLFGWYFQYIPIGRSPDTSMMPTPTQRAKFRYDTYAQRNEHPIFVVDFWNDGPAAYGCLAGGRLYFHVNTEGDVEPCVFAHFAVDNINEKSVLECIKSPFFAAIRERIPYDGNELLPCMIIDRPDVLRSHVRKFGAKTTCEGGDSIITTLADDIDKYSSELREIYNPAWKAGDWIRHYPDPPAGYA